VDTQDKFLAGVLNAAAHINKREEQLKYATRNVRARVAKCIQADGWIFEYLF
jgi:hypothetical protein